MVALLLAAMCFLAYYGMRELAPATEEHERVDLTVEQEIRIGIEAAPRIMERYGGLHPDRRLHARAAEVGGRLVSRSRAGRTPYAFRFHVLAAENAIDAFALPGGQVCLTAGLLSRLITEGELAGVLGHQISHVVARHVSEQLRRAVPSGRRSSRAFPLAKSVWNDARSARSNAVSVFVSNHRALRFASDEELEADQLALRFLTEAGYDPRALARVMDLLSASGAGAADFLRAHPDPDRRLERIRSAMEALFPIGVPAGLVE
jgi:predicted Zn-dependent protease